MNRILVPLALAAALAVPAGANASPLLNGDFETGNLSGWTTFLTPNGTLGGGFPQVTPFDTNNDSVLSLAAAFRAGQVVFQGGVPAGGGLFQVVSLGAGNLTIAADIASQNLNGAGNASGGIVELLFDGVVVDSHDFGDIAPNATEFDGLSAFLPSVTAGLHEVRLRFTRPFLPGAPVQYLDNVRLSGTAVAAVPEPASLALFGLAGLTAGYVGWRRRKPAAA